MVEKIKQNWQWLAAIVATAAIAIVATGFNRIDAVAEDVADVTVMNVAILTTMQSLHTKLPSTLLGQAPQTYDIMPAMQWTEVGSKGCEYERDLLLRAVYGAREDLEGGDPKKASVKLDSVLRVLGY